MKKRVPPQENNSSRREAEEQPASDSKSFEEVRERLRSFGYLNSRIERFYFSSFRLTASQFLNRSLLSFRAGLLMGTLSALLMTFGTLIFNDALLKNKFDLLLLFIYFEIFFVLLASILEFVLIFIVAAFLRIARGRTVFFAGQALSIAVGLIFFGYFFYWGKTQIEYLRLLSSPALFTIVVVLVISCVFISRCAWLGFLIAFHQADIRPVSRNWKRYAMEVIVALAAVAILLPFLTGRGHANQEGGPPVAVLTTPDRWIVIGVDGFSEELLERFLSSGSFPNIARLRSNSFRGRLQVNAPVVPPVAWTTLATGVSPAEHGILMPDVRRWPGLNSWMQTTPFELALGSIRLHTSLSRRQPVSGSLRKVKTFWEILSANGIRSGVVNWWGSWPAYPLRGWNVSERYYYKLLSGEKAQDETYPRDLFARYQIPKTKLNASIRGPEIDSFYADVFSKQLQQDPVRVAALYLPGFDILNYEFFQAKRTDPFTYTELYRRHVLWLDALLGSLAARHSDYHLILIFYQGRCLERDHSELMIQGGVGSRSNLSFAETEIVPLLLYTCGLPVTSSMKIDLLRAYVNPTLLARVPVRFVTGYPKKSDQLDTAHLGDFNDLLVEQMKSLGYLQ